MTRDMTGGLLHLGTVTNADQRTRIGDWLTRQHLRYKGGKKVEAMQKERDRFTWTRFRSAHAGLHMEQTGMGPSRGRMHTSMA